MTSVPVVKCDCEGFVNSEHQLDAAQEIAWIHGWRYTGDIFRYCPWCGKEFETIDVDEIYFT